MKTKEMRDRATEFAMSCDCDSGPRMTDACSRCREIARMLAELRQAVGLATTLKPDMEIDVLHPLEMMQQVVAYVAAKDAEIARLMVEREKK